VVAELTGAALKDLKKYDEIVGGNDIYFVMEKQPLGYRWVMANGPDGVAMVAEKIGATSFVAINISRLIREMDSALEQ